MKYDDSVDLDGKALEASTTMQHEMYSMNVIQDIDFRNMIEEDKVDHGLGIEQEAGVDVVIAPCNLRRARKDQITAHEKPKVDDRNEFLFILEEVKNGGRARACFMITGMLCVVIQIASEGEEGQDARG